MFEVRTMLNATVKSSHDTEAVKRNLRDLHVLLWNTLTIERDLIYPLSICL